MFHLNFKYFNQSFLFYLYLFFILFFIIIQCLLYLNYLSKIYHYSNGFLFFIKRVHLIIYNHFKSHFVFYLFFNSHYLFLFLIALSNHGNLFFFHYINLIRYSRYFGLFEFEQLLYFFLFTKLLSNTRMLFFLKLLIQYEVLVIQKEE